MGAEMPLQIANPKHEFRHIGGPWGKLDLKELIRVDDEQWLGLAEVDHEGGDFALQPFHHLQGVIE
ncbi:hypothetical protein C8N36_1484 [Pelagimonas varians]|nr:hypothetical protein C8N36_1484 [Pelagimonas varians]